MDVLGNGLVMYYTPHQCWYSDRKSPYWENNQKIALRCFRNINNNSKHSAQLVLPIFNPLHHTWAISAPPKGQKDNFGLKQPSCHGEDYFAYLKLA